MAAAVRLPWSLKISIKIMVSIREAGESDGNLIAALSRQTFTEAFSTVNTPENMALFMDGPFSVATLEAETKMPGLWFFIAWDEGLPVGYMKLKMHMEGHPDIKPGQPTFEICRIYVIQSQAGKGIGQKMMDRAFSLAREKGYGEVCLGVWENNLRAISFYERNGFEKVGSHSFLLGTDNQTDWLMAKKT